MNWKYGTGIDNVNSILNEFSLPKKPSTFGEEYQFPEDVSNLVLQDLGQWLFKLSGWKGFTLKKLAYAEVEESILMDSYSVCISKNMIKIESDKKLVKEAMIGKTLSENEMAKELKIKSMETSAKVKGLKRIVELYSIQLDTISREISRRAMELK